MVTVSNIATDESTSYEIIDDAEVFGKSLICKKVICGKTFNQKLTLSHHQLMNGAGQYAIDMAIDNFERQCQRKEIEMAPTATATSNSMYYFTTSTPATTTASSTVGGSHHYDNSTTATIGTSGWVDTFYHREEQANNMVYLNNLWIKKSNLTHTQSMQLKINQQWSRHCASETYEKQRKQRAARERAAKAAESKALLLLESFIGEEEMERYKQTGQVYVKGKNGLYLAKKGGGVSKVEGKRLINFCVYTNRKYKCPPTDDVIALKTMLEYDDEKVIQIANRMGSSEVEELPIAACM